MSSRLWLSSFHTVPPGVLWLEFSTLLDDRMSCSLEVLVRSFPIKENLRLIGGQENFLANRVMEPIEFASSSCLSLSEGIPGPIFSRTEIGTSDPYIPKASSRAINVIG